jgi:hypothetical protein
VDTSDHMCMHIQHFGQALDNWQTVFFIFISHLSIVAWIPESAGEIAAVKDENGVKRKSQALFLQKYIPGAYNVGDWRLPSSPAIALMFAQDDIRKRLNLQSKSKVLSTKLSM